MPFAVESGADRPPIVVEEILMPNVGPVEQVAAASAFLQSLVPLQGRQVRTWLDTLPPTQAESVRYQQPPNALLTLQDPAHVQPLPTAEKSLLLEGLVRVFSADGGYAGPSDEGGIVELFFTLWLDEILHQSALLWARDRDEAWDLFLFAAGMMADTGLHARISACLPADHVILRGDLHPPVRRYGNGEVMASEIIGFLLDLLASPHLDAEHDARMAVAMVIHNHERHWRGLGNFHGHGLIDAIHDEHGRRQTIFEALCRSGGMTAEELLTIIRQREIVRSFSQQLPLDGFDEPEYFGAD
jgi:hypothetical protein